MHLILRLFFMGIRRAVSPLFVIVAIGLRRLGLRAGLARTTSWVPVQGRVQSVKVTEISDRYEGDSFHAQLSYSYQYEGEYYGDHYTYDSRNRESAIRFANEHPERSVVEVRVNPRKPAKSKLALQP